MSILKEVNCLNNHIAVLLSGGIGNRMQMNIPKQYLNVGGHPIVYYSLKVLLDNEDTDVIVLVVAEEWKLFVTELIDSIPHNKTILFALPGETREYSIFNALKVIKEFGYNDDDIVLVHEAARPLLKHRLIKDCYDGCKDYDCVVPVIPVKNTLYFSEDGEKINSLLERSKIWSGQAPEAFKLGKFYQAHIDTPREKILSFNGGTELAFYYGMSCRLIKGDPFCFKVTTQDDLILLMSLIERGEDRNE